MINRPLAAQRRSEQRNQGFTLTEIAIVLGIIGLILGAIWVAAAGVYNNNRVNTANTGVMQITQGVRSLFSTSNSDNATGASVDMTADLIQANVIPPNLANTLVVPNVMVGPFPGGTGMVIATGDGLGFVISMSNVTQANCQALLTQVGGQSRDPGLFEAEAVATAAPAAGDAPAVTPAVLTSSVTPQVAAAAAGATITNAGGCTNTLNKVIFGFTLK